MKIGDRIILITSLFRCNPDSRHFAFPGTHKIVSLSPIVVDMSGKSAHHNKKDLEKAIEERKLKDEGTLSDFEVYKDGSITASWSYTRVFSEEEFLIVPEEIQDTYGESFRKFVESSRQKLLNKTMPVVRR